MFFRAFAQGLRASFRTLPASSAIIRSRLEGRGKDRSGLDAAIGSDFPGSAREASVLRKPLRIAPLHERRGLPLGMLKASQFGSQSGHPACFNSFEPETYPCWEE